MEEKKYCYKYPHPAVTTDCVIFGFDGKRLHILLIERGLEPYKGSWALPGGFLKMDETVEEGAARELYEETHVKDVYLEQFKVFSTVDRDPRERVITVAFMPWCARPTIAFWPVTMPPALRGSKWMSCLPWLSTMRKSSFRHGST